jgi:hypothetical protein
VPLEMPRSRNYANGTGVTKNTNTDEEEQHRMMLIYNDGIGNGNAKAIQLHQKFARNFYERHSRDVSPPFANHFASLAVHKPPVHTVGIMLL